MELNINGTWGRICRQAGVEGVTIHDLRRTYITRLVRRGCPMAHVQKLAGHTRPETTLKYYTWVTGTICGNRCGSYSAMWAESCDGSVTVLLPTVKNRVLDRAGQDSNLRHSD